jgi:bifunctional DNA-binding transcriptional regulator/antitoxin component of YhaV-PrlF toxin-antitoxin module
VVPTALRRHFGIEEGSLIIWEDREVGMLIRPAIAVPLESYTPKRRAQFLLSNAVNEEDYARAEEEVCKLGPDPATIPHRSP